jgi:hypothetical protein
VVELGRRGRPCEWWRRRSRRQNVERTEVEVVGRCGLQPEGHGASAVTFPPLTALTYAGEKTRGLERQIGSLLGLGCPPPPSLPLPPPGVGTCRGSCATAETVRPHCHLPPTSREQSVSSLPWPSIFKPPLPPRRVRGAQGDLRAPPPPAAFPIDDLHHRQQLARATTGAIAFSFARRQCRLHPRLEPSS